MSIVGPRPHLIEHNREFSKILGNYHVRTFVKPGITGLAQVRGFRGEARNPADIENRITCDIEYLENWNLSLECDIILRTLAQLVFPHRSAYYVFATLTANSPANFSNPGRRSNHATS